MIATQKSPIKNLSDKAPPHRLEKLAAKVRKTTTEILLHSNEVERRRLYLPQGYASLFDYCTGHLGYSESAANRRIRAARCLRDFPEIVPLLEKNELNVSTVCMVAGILSKSNKKELLAEVRSRSQRDVDTIISRYRPPQVVHDRIRPITVRTTAAVADVRASDATHGRQPEKRVDSATHENWQEVYRRCGGRELTTPQGPGRGDNRARENAAGRGERLEQKYKLEFAVGPEFMNKLEEVKALLSNRYPRGLEFERLFETLIDEFLEHYSPRAAHERRETRKQKSMATRQTAHEKERDGRADVTTHARSQKRRDTGGRHSRHIPTAVRDRVFTRDDGRCTCVGAAGKRCNSIWGLHIDHIKPYAQGGTNSPDNLRILCAKHNRLEAERIYGGGFMERYYKRE